MLAQVGWALAVALNRHLPTRGLLPQRQSRLIDEVGRGVVDGWKVVCSGRREWGSQAFDSAAAKCQMPEKMEWSLQIFSLKLPSLALFQPVCPTHHQQLAYRASNQLHPASRASINPPSSYLVHPTLRIHSLPPSGPIKLTLLTHSLGSLFSPGQPQAITLHRSCLAVSPLLSPGYSFLTTDCWPAQSPLHCSFSLPCSPYLPIHNINQPAAQSPNIYSTTPPFHELEPLFPSPAPPRL